MEDNPLDPSSDDDTADRDPAEFLKKMQKISALRGAATGGSSQSQSGGGYGSSILSTLAKLGAGSGYGGGDQ